jgi:hypothetical protein
MIRSFRTAIWTLGSGSILIATAALSRDQLPHWRFLADRGPGAAHSAWDEPVQIAGVPFLKDAEPSGHSIGETLPPLVIAANSAGPKIATIPAPAAQKSSAVFQNASLRSAPGQNGPSIQIGPLLPAEKTISQGQTATKEAPFRAARPVVVLRPEERPIAGREKKSAAPSEGAAPSAEIRAERSTRLYRPADMSVSDLERLVRPLLTPGIGTATAITTASTDGEADAGASGGRPSPQFGSKEPRRDLLVVHDRLDVLRQIDALYADLEAAPQRVVIDALIADVALPDSVAPGWELPQSRFGVIEAEPRTVLNSLRIVGRVCVIATNQLQVIDRQWAQLEWTERDWESSGATERARDSSGATESVAAAHDASLRRATKFRIRPSVLSNGLVRLEVHPTSSRLKEGSSVRPEIATVAFTTDIVLHAGATAIFVGLVDERSADVEPPSSASKGVSPPGDAPNIHPRPSVRHETVLLLMPRISPEN